MRIIHSLEGHGWSGGQQQALFLAQTQAAFGHEVLLLCQKGSELQTRAIKAGLTVQPHDYRKEIHPLSLLELKKTYDAFRPDIVNVHRAWAHTQWVLVALHRRFRGLIVTRRVLFKPDFNPLSLIKYRTSAVRGYIAVSEAVAERLRTLGLPAKKLIVVHPATDMEYFNPSTAKNPGLPTHAQSHPKLILFVANYHKNKGHHLILEAFATVWKRHPEAFLVFAGNGLNHPDFVQRMQKNPAQANILSLGFRRDIPDLLSQAACFVNASYEEGFSGGNREALAMGVPVIASNIPANREMARFAPLSLFDAGSATSLAEKVTATLTQPISPQDKQSIRDAAVQAFSVPAMVSKTIRAYEEFLGIAP